MRLMEIVWIAEQCVVFRMMEEGNKKCKNKKKKEYWRHFCVQCAFIEAIDNTDGQREKEEEKERRWRRKEREKKTWATNCRYVILRCCCSFFVAFVSFILILSCIMRLSAQEEWRRWTWWSKLRKKKTHTEENIEEERICMRIKCWYWLCLQIYINEEANCSIRIRPRMHTDRNGTTKILRKKCNIKNVFFLHLLCCAFFVCLLFFFQTSIG